MTETTSKGPEFVLRETSIGLVGLRFNSVTSEQFGVAVVVFDANGWGGEASHWAPYGEKKERLDVSEEQSSLGAAVSRATNIPEDEAMVLAGELLREWRARGDDDVGRGDALKGLAFITVVGTGISIAIVVAVAVVVFLIFVLVNIV